MCKENLHAFKTEKLGAQIGLAYAGIQDKAFNFAYSTVTLIS